MRNAAAGSMNHAPSQLRLAASVDQALVLSLPACGGGGAVADSRAKSVIANAPDSFDHLRSPQHASLPPGGGCRALARREGVAVVRHLRRGMCCAAVTPPRTAFGGPTLPFRGG